VDICILGSECLPLYTFPLYDVDYRFLGLVMAKFRGLKCKGLYKIILIYSIMKYINLKARNEVKLFSVTAKALNLALSSVLSSVRACFKPILRGFMLSPNISIGVV